MPRPKPRSASLDACYARDPVPPVRFHVTTNPAFPVLVVGAGPAGLAAMSALREAGVAFAAVESHSEVGGIWDASNPVSSVYEGLRTVTSRYTSHLGTPMPHDWPDYPTHEQVLGYFRQFAETEQLRPRIAFATRLEGAEKTDRGTWMAALRTAAGTVHHREVRGLVMATGSHNRQHSLVPQALWDEARAAGLHVIHSADYRTPAPYAGKRVLVVGVGNSGSDIAEKISGVARRTLLAIRTTPWINPPTLGGVPCDHLAATPSRLPAWLALGLFHAARWYRVGGFRRLGLSRPRHGLNDRLPISDRGIVRAIRDRRVIARSHVTRLDDGVAHFADRRHPAEPVDAVVFATGFRRSYPLLEDGADGQDPLLLHLFHRREPGLTYMTEVIGMRSCWPIFVEQGRAVAAYFAAEARGGDRVAIFNARRGLPTPDCKGGLFRLADGYHLDYAIYTRLLQEFVAWISANETEPAQPSRDLHAAAAT